MFYAHVRQTNCLGLFPKGKNDKAGDKGHCPGLDPTYHIQGSESCKGILVLTDFNSSKQKHENLLSTILVNRT